MSAGKSLMTRRMVDRIRGPKQQILNEKSEEVEKRRGERLARKERVDKGLVNGSPDAVDDLSMERRNGGE
jgi:hypothetical protein